MGSLIIATGPFTTSTQNFLKSLENFSRHDFIYTISNMYLNIFCQKAWISGRFWNFGIHQSNFRSRNSDLPLQNRKLKWKTTLRNTNAMKQIWNVFCFPLVIYIIRYLGYKKFDLLLLCQTIDFSQNWKDETFNPPRWINRRRKNCISTQGMGSTRCILCWRWRHFIWSKNKDGFPISII